MFLLKRASSQVLSQVKNSGGQGMEKQAPGQFWQHNEVCVGIKQRKGAEGGVSGNLPTVVFRVIL